MRLRIGAYTACVVVDGEERECYDVRTSPDGKTVECWIVSEVGKAFSVEYTHPETVVGHSALFVDGIPARGFTINHPGPSSVPGHSIKDVATSATTTKPLQFSNVELTEDDQYLGAAAEDSNTLKLHLRLAQYTLSTDPLAHICKSLPGTKKVHERTKKGLLAHTIGTGQEVTIAPPKACWTPKYLGDIGTFIFRYTSRDILVAQGIIKKPAPIAPPPPIDPPTQVNEVEALREKVLNLEKRLQEMQDASPAPSTSTKVIKREGIVKRERPSTSEDTLDLTGSESVPAKKRHKSLKVKHEVLDLTLD